jgi:hypothetical protein
MYPLYQHSMYQRAAGPALWCNGRGGVQVGEARRTARSVAVAFRDGGPPGGFPEGKPVAAATYRRGVRVTFPRLADGTRTYSVVERGDGVRYRVYDGTATSRLPHDLGHLIVERETGDHGGFWGAVAAGVVFSSMEHLDGRRPPHARERSEAAMRERSDGLRRAELMVWLTERVARDGVTTPHQVRAMAAEALSSFPEAQVDAEQVLAAARALQAAAERWAELSPGEELVVEWPDGRSRRAAPRSRRPEPRRRAVGGRH